jgi:hypothetical protein
MTAIIYETEKYHRPPLVILPIGADFLVGYGYSPGREFISRMTEAELLSFLRTPIAEPIRRPAFNLDRPSGLDLDMELDI